ncbi:MAG: hypothetical protein ABUT39_04540 [Acidobacteriota bacterium]
MAQTAEYVLELGLDENVAPTSDGSYPLMQSVARREGPETWVPAWYTGFKPGDRVSFRFADYTSASDDTPLVPVMVLISFRKPENPTQLSNPFKEKINPISILSSGFSLKSGKGSIILPAPLGSRVSYWYFVDSKGEEARFTFASAKLLKRFLLRLEIAVLHNDELRFYGHDPEIFVGEGGPPPGPPPRRRR